MAIRWYSVVIDCHDMRAQAAWWAEALGWEKTFEADDEVSIEPPWANTDEGQAIPVERRVPGLVFTPVPEGKTVKNRLHFDLAPRAGEDQAAAVERLERMGARRIDVGQRPEHRWVVLADPEGNEFCVLTPRD